MFDQLVLATQLALENVNSNEMRSVMDNVHARNITNQSDPVNIMINPSRVNALLINEEVY